MELCVHVSVCVFDYRCYSIDVRKLKKYLKLLVQRNPSSLVGKLRCYLLVQQNV